eukprot:924577-Rhodomonas_salina.3
MLLCTLTTRPPAPLACAVNAIVYRSPAFSTRKEGNPITSVVPDRPSVLNERCADDRGWVAEASGRDAVGYEVSERVAELEVGGKRVARWYQELPTMPKRSHGQGQQVTEQASQNKTRAQKQERAQAQAGSHRRTSRTRRSHARVGRHPDVIELSGADDKHVGEHAHGAEQQPRSHLRRNQPQVGPRDDQFEAVQHGDALDERRGVVPSHAIRLRARDAAAELLVEARAVLAAAHAWSDTVPVLHACLTRYRCDLSSPCCRIAEHSVEELVADYDLGRRGERCGGERRGDACFSEHRLRGHCDRLWTPLLD